MHELLADMHGSPDIFQRGCMWQRKCPQMLLMTFSETSPPNVPLSPCEHTGGKSLGNVPTQFSVLKWLCRNAACVFATRTDNTPTFGQDWMSLSHGHSVSPVRCSYAKSNKHLSGEVNKSSKTSLSKLSLRGAMNFHLKSSLSKDFWWDLI